MTKREGGSRRYGAAVRKGRISAYSPGSKRSGEDVAWVAKIIARLRQKVRRELGQRARQLELAVIENESDTIQIEDFERSSALVTRPSTVMSSPTT
jgi:hypothetical protein